MKLPQLYQQGFAHLFLLILLVAGIGLGVYLVGQKTNIFPRANSNPISGPIESPPPSPSPVSSLIPSPSPYPSDPPCDPKKFDAKTWKILDVGVCRKGKQNIRYICQNKRKIIQFSCPQSTKPPSSGN